MKWHPRPVIDLTTFTVYPSLMEAGKALKTTTQNICMSINNNQRAKKHKLEYLDFFHECYTEKEKNKYGKRFNIYFMEF